MRRYNAAREPLHGNATQPAHHARGGGGVRAGTNRERGNAECQARDCYDGSHFCETTPLFRAAPGERNDVSASGGSDGVIVRDTGGGVGSDRLQGGAGADTLSGGSGDDLLSEGPGRDTLDGGDGLDRASFLGGPPVVVDLGDPGPDGPPAEPDMLLGFEQVFGSDGADTLRGDDDANLLDGGAGDDRIIGQAGNDVLLGGTGFDRLSGGAGDDELAPDDENAEGSQPGGELADCGEGTDLVSEQSHDVLIGCERLELPLGIAAPEFDPRVVLIGRTAALRLHCSTKLRFRARPGCRIQVTLSEHGRREARSRRERLPRGRR